MCSLSWLRPTHFAPAGVALPFAIRLRVCKSPVVFGYLCTHVFQFSPSPPPLPLAPPHILIQRLDMNDPGFWEKVLGAKPAQRLLNDLTQGKLDGAKAEAIEVYITGGQRAGIRQAGMQRNI